MTRVIVDAALAETFMNAKKPLEICDASGKVIGLYQPLPDPAD